MKSRTVLVLISLLILSEAMNIKNQIYGANIQQQIGKGKNVNQQYNTQNVDNIKYDDTPIYDTSTFSQVKSNSGKQSQAGKTVLNGYQVQQQTQQDAIDT